jgi:ADP-ribosylation factor-like protein 8
MAMDTVVVTQPTMGSNCEEITQGNIKLQVWDLSGHESTRQAWMSYCQGVHAVIFVVDASD